MAFAHWAAAGWLSVTEELAAGRFRATSSIDKARIWGPWFKKKKMIENIGKTKGGAIFLFYFRGCEFEAKLQRKTFFTFLSVFFSPFAINGTKSPQGFRKKTKIFSLMSVK